MERLLVHGASAAFIDSTGDLLTYPQYDDVCFLMESYRQAHTKEVIGCILEMPKIAVSLLKKMFLVSRMKLLILYLDFKPYNCIE